MIKNIWNKIKDNWKSIIVYIDLLSSLITIGLFVTHENRIFKYIFGSITIVFFFSIVTYILISIISTSRAKKALDREYLNKNMQLSEAMHKFYHNLRNYSSLIDASKSFSDKDVRLSCQNICNYISEIFLALFNTVLENNKISVCIKLIKTESIFDEDYESWKMETIARSTSTDQERSNIDRKPVSVSKNSDFKIILSRKYSDEVFSFTDMRNIKKDFLCTYTIPYENSRDNFLDYYRSTIVVPIKIDGRYVSNKIKLVNKKIEDRDLVLGFVCIDSMKIFETENEKKLFSIGVEYAKGIGDSLYFWFEKILMSRLEKEKKQKMSNEYVTPSHNNQYQTKNRTYNNSNGKKKKKRGQK